jgi:hypothetical protein
MKLPRSLSTAFDLLGLAWDIGAAIVSLVKPEKKKRGLTHKDSEIQAQAARRARKETK